MNGLGERFGWAVWVSGLGGRFGVNGLGERFGWAVWVMGLS